MVRKSTALAHLRNECGSSRCGHEIAHTWITAYLPASHTPLDCTNRTFDVRKKKLVPRIISRHVAGFWFSWFIWFVWFVWFVWFKERNKLEKPDRPNKRDRLLLNRSSLTQRWTRQTLKVDYPCFFYPTNPGISSTRLGGSESTAFDLGPHFISCDRGRSEESQSHDRK